MADWETPDYEKSYSPELNQAARKLVVQVMHVRPEEEVAITADTRSDRHVVNATIEAINVEGARSIAIWHQLNPFPCMEPPSCVAAALKVADLWIEYAGVYTLYSRAYQEAIDAGCRYVCLPGMDADMMVRTIGKVDLELVNKMGNELHQMSQRAKRIKVSSPAGTNISVEVNPEISPFDGSPELGTGYATMLAGQAGFNTYAETYNGKLVLNGALWPPDEIGVIHSPIKLTVDSGTIVAIDGGHEAQVFRSWLHGFGHPAMFMLDHVCYGFNPGVRRLSGRILEDERLFGCVEFGIGCMQKGAPCHSDGVILHPSVWIDDRQIESNGVYVDQKLVDICRQLGIAGY